jgi:hypothetical protein
VYLSRNLDDPRRRLLLKLLAANALLTLPAASGLADVFGEVPKRLPPNRSVYRMRGRVTVNQKSATLETRIAQGDSIETGRGAEIVFVAGTSAYLARELTKFSFAQEVQDRNIVTDVLRIVTGKILAVFQPGKPQRIHTFSATMGVRGTGVYLEADPEQTYLCTCYGMTEIAANNDKASRKTVTATHHDEPVYILAKAAEGKSIRPAPFVNHTDAELMLIETLVGRTPPFVFPSDDYRAPRRDY